MSESHFMSLFREDNSNLEDKKLNNTFLSKDAKEFLKMRADSLSCPPATMDTKAPSSPLPLDQFFIVDDPSHSYVREYQEKKNLNPRLPKPIPAFVFQKNKPEMSLTLPTNLDMKFSKAMSTQQAPQNSPPREQSNGWDDQEQADDVDNYNEDDDPTSPSKNSSVVDRIQQQFPRTPSPVYQKMNEPLQPHHYFNGLDQMGIVDDSNANFGGMDQLVPQEEDVTGEENIFFNDQGAVDSLEMHMRKLSMGGDMNDGTDLTGGEDEMQMPEDVDLQNQMGMDYLSDKNSMKQYGMMNSNFHNSMNMAPHGMQMGMNMNSQAQMFPPQQHGFMPAGPQSNGMPSIPTIPSMQYNGGMIGGMNSQMMASMNGMAPMNPMMNQAQNMRMMNPKQSQQRKMFAPMPNNNQPVAWTKGGQIFMVPPPPVTSVPQTYTMQQATSFPVAVSQTSPPGGNFYNAGGMIVAPQLVVQNQQQTNSNNQNAQNNQNKKFLNSQRQKNHFGNGPKSKLMEDFKQGKKIELGDIKGHVVEFSRDQYGSRFIQKKLEDEELPPADQHLVFQEILPEALSLMTDVFGNYVIQKFFENGTSHQKKQLVKVMKGHVLALTLQTYGCRVIQKALDKIDDEDKYLIAQELDGHVMRCIQDQNGNHVIQKCIETIPQNMVRFIVDSFEGQVQRQATHSYGCRVIQRILENCPEQTDKIMDEVVESIHQLVRDPYGNYVVQHVLQKGLPKHKSLLIKTLKPKIAEYSFDKYASNVIEGCFTNGSKKERTEMVQEIVAANKDFSASPLLKMMNNQYANYVIQKIIEISDPQQRKMLFDRMKPNLAQIRKLAYGKHVIAKMEQLGLS